jgi:hypothetical protein
MVTSAVVLPLKNICTLKPLASRSIGAPVPLKISSALLFEEPSTYSEKNKSVGCAKSELRSKPNMIVAVRVKVNRPRTIGVFRGK